MSAKHTPGPWGLLFVGEGRLARLCPCAGKEPEPLLTIVEEDGVQFAVVLKEADARLIAAAPELLEALRVALKALDEIGDAMTVGDRFTNAGARLCIAVPAARAAITKAMGGS